MAETATVTVGYRVLVFASAGLIGARGVGLVVATGQTVV